MKKIFMTILIILMMGTLSGCGMNEEDAKAYVKASLDATYKGEFDEFVEITDSTPEGAKAMYEENIIHIVEETVLKEANLNDELVEKYKQFYNELIKNADYSVGEAVKNDDDSFSVEVIVRPLTIFLNVEEELSQITTERLLDDLEKFSSDEEIEIMVYEELCNILSDRLDEPVYSDETVTVMVDLYKNSEGKYAIEEEDMLTLDNSLFAVQ